MYIFAKQKNTMTHTVFTPEEIALFESKINSAISKGNCKVIINNHFMSNGTARLNYYLDTHYPSSFSKNPFQNIYIVTKNGKKINPKYISQTN